MKTSFSPKGPAVAFLALLVVCLAWAYAQVEAPKAKVNINTASLAQLQELPRIGEKIAQRIIDYRTANGNFRKIEEIMKVKGIGEKLFAELKSLITVGPEAAVK